MRVLDFLLCQHGPFAYADLSTPVFVCSKPLDLEESNGQLCHLRKRGAEKTPCTMEGCKKKFRDSDKLYTHLLEHPQFSGQPDEMQDEIIDRLTFRADEVRLPSVKCLSVHSPGQASRDAKD